MGDARTICLVTPGHLVSTPRLVRAADALASAGHRVQVIASRHFAPNDAPDAAIMRTALWQAQRIATATLDLRLTGKWVRWIAGRTTKPSANLAAWSLAPAWKTLAKAAVLTKADYFIGHCVGAMPAVAWAARRRGVPYGLDLEDHHETETLSIEQDARQRRLLRTLFGQLLPAAAHLTAAAPLMAERYALEYGVQPRVVLNVLPRADAPPSPAACAPVTVDRPARCYWFSQVIGPGRGLESFLKVMTAMKTPVELHLRGLVTPAYRTALEALSPRRRIVFHPFSDSADMARLAVDYDLGLSIEPHVPANRELCLANKIFCYLLAGLPQVLTPTKAQCLLASELASAALLLDLEAYAPSAERLDRWFSDTAARTSARQTAWQLGQQHYCWDIEQANLLSALNAGLK